PFIRPFAHFYNPQKAGGEDTGLSQFGASVGPSSVDWMLKRGVGSTNQPLIFTSGLNHFTYMDAREYFYKALTSTNAETTRKKNWGLTFQALGHIMHHLQDMASPQHVRNDSHCTSKACAALGAYRPSGYELYWERNFTLIRNLAQMASAPIMFGLPREFWNIDLNDQLKTTRLPNPNTASAGIAAYTSSNFTSVGRDFEVWGLNTPTPQYLPAEGLPFPEPSGVWNEVNVSELFPPENLATVRDTLCGGTTTNCVMKFMGTKTDPSARTSAQSYFAKELLVPRVNNNNQPNDPPAYTGSGPFQQNFFTYTDAASKLVPTAVSYSAGLINYFFRGELEIKLPDEGVYGILDHAVEKNKNADGFRLIKAKVKNATQPISVYRSGAGVPATEVPQHMTDGTFVAVAKFHRNTCYTPDLFGQIGQPGINWQTCRSPSEEIVVSAPATEWSGGSATSGAAIVATAINAGVEKTLSFDFSANPIPIEATDLFIQVVFKGKLGEE
ncbi:MAG: hypothetical protein ACRCWJ_12940, partial [Casimicrobium sp.]